MVIIAGAWCENGSQLEKAHVNDYILKTISIIENNYHVNVYVKLKTITKKFF